MNYKLFQMINQMAGHHHFLDGLMIFVSQKALYIFALVLLLMWIFGKEKNKHTVVIAVITGVIGLLINFVIGHIYFEPRPFVTHHVNLLVKHAADASFPSDHTTGAFCLALAILCRHRKIGSGMLLFAILTGFSRVYVGNHYPFDILGSIVVSLIISPIIYKFNTVFKPITQFILGVYNRIPFVSKDIQA